MTKDIRLAVETCEEEGNDQAILLKCTSAYPAPYDAVNLKMIPAMAKTFDCLTGLSDHTMGYQAAIGAAAIGACVIEKHLTLKREDGGADAAFFYGTSGIPGDVRGSAHCGTGVGKRDLRSVGKAKKREGTFPFFVCDKRYKSRRIFLLRKICAPSAPVSDCIRSILRKSLGKRAAQDLETGTPMHFSYVKGMEDRKDELGLD